MAQYYLYGGPTVGSAVITALPAITIKMAPSGPLATTSPNAEVFMLEVTGAGTVTAVGQVMATIDGSQWVNIGPALTATGTNAGVTSLTNGNSGWDKFGFVLTSISGTGALAKCIAQAG